MTLASKTYERCDPAASRTLRRSPQPLLQAEASLERISAGSTGTLNPEAATGVGGATVALPLRTHDRQVAKGIASIETAR